MKAMNITYGFIVEGFNYDFNKHVLPNQP
uniref:Uncharacterized protein n=1 Tax=Ralstonia solanacearum TaxID=305 RepID=A0A0S4TMN4_RALSL|nr:protein of unknown function [Ralstonia solanacearum]